MLCRGSEGRSTHADALAWPPEPTANVPFQPAYHMSASITRAPYCRQGCTQRPCHRPYATKPTEAPIPAARSTLVHGTRTGTGKSYGSGMRQSADHNDVANNSSGGHPTGLTCPPCAAMTLPRPSWSLVTPTRAPLYQGPAPHPLRTPLRRRHGRHGHNQAAAGPRICCRWPRRASHAGGSQDVGVGGSCC